MQKNLIIKKPKVCMPFVEGFYENLSNYLRKHNIIAVPMIFNNLTNIVIKAKDKFAKEKSCGVIYKFDCQDCPATYIGQSKRQVGIRISEHKTPIDALINEKYKKEKETAKNLDKPKTYNQIPIRQVRIKNPPIYVKTDMNNCDKIKKNSNQDESLVLKHYKEKNHNFNWEKF